MSDLIQDLNLKDFSQLVYLDVLSPYGSKSDLSELYKSNIGRIKVRDLIDYYTGEGKFNGNTEGIDTLKQRYTEKQFNEWTQFLQDIKENKPEYLDWEITNVVSYNKSNDSGFVAFTVEPEPGTKIVAFRGSEDIGKVEYRNDWDNNATTAYISESRQQAEARDYLTKYVSADELQQLYFTGHSLGGNLALYSSFVLPDELRDKLVTATTFNAPGFNRNVLEQYSAQINEMVQSGRITEYQNIRDAVPALLYNPTRGILINSVSDSANPLDHHGLSSYEVKDGELVPADRQSRRPEIRIIHYFTTGFEALPDPIKRTIATAIFKVWNGRWDFYDFAALAGLAVLLVTAGPLVLLKTIVTAVLGLLVVGFFMSEVLPLLAKGWNFIVDKLTAFKDAALQWVKDFVQEVGNMLGLVGKELLEFKDRAVQAVESFLNRCRQLIESFANFMREQIDKVKKWWDGFTDRVARIANDIAEKTVSFVRNTAENIKTGVRELKDEAIRRGGELKDAVIRKAKDLASIAARAGRTVMDGLHQVKQKLSEWGKQARDWMQEVTARAIQEIRDSAKAVVNKVTEIRERIGRLGSAVFSKGKKLFRSFVNVGSRVTQGSRIKADLDQLEATYRSLRRRQADVEAHIQRVLSVVASVASDTERNYPEGYVRSQVREVEALCEQLRREHRELNEQLRKISDGMKYSVNKYRETEISLRSSRIALA